MINIDDAISKSKQMENVSNGGSACFDFGDVVLVKYACPLEYLKEGEHVRDTEEIVMQGANIKADQGVNTPRHIDFKRVIEGKCEVCYVLQEKCKGKNGESFRKSNVTFDEMINSFEYVYNIPFEHYRKLVHDSSMCYEMGYESKPKNYFYDEETGFWLIDFLDYDKEHPFNPNDTRMLMKFCVYGYVPSVFNMTSSMSYADEKNLSQEQKNIYDNLLNSIKAKQFLSKKTEIPQVDKYEKFILMRENEIYRKMLMDSGIVKKDLFSLNDEDYATFDELYNDIVDEQIKNINKGIEFWDVECNTIRNDCSLFGLYAVWKIHKDNPIKIEDCEDKWEYQSNSEDVLKGSILNSVVEKLRLLEKNENVDKFLTEYELKCAKEKIDNQQKLESQESNLNPIQDNFEETGHKTY